MSLASAARVALTTLRDHPLRTLLATTGIVIGSASLGGVLAIGDGMKRAILERVAQEGYTLVSVTPRTGDELNGVRMPRERWPVLTEADRRALETRLGAQARVELAMQATTRFALPDKAQPYAAYLLGIASPAPDSLQYPLAHGRRPTGAELLGAHPVAMVSDTLARLVAGTPERAVGRTLSLEGETVTIVGVTPRAPLDAARLVVPFAIARRLAPSPAVVTGLRVFAPDVAAVRGVEQATTAWFAEARPMWRDSIDVNAPNARRLDDIENSMQAFKLAMGAFAGITLLVGGIGIANVLLSSVHERTREIGIRRAIGARKRDLLLQFLLEAVTITGVGSMAGLVLGVLTALAATAVIRARTGVAMYAALSPSTVLAGVVVAITVGLAAGIAPALRAARLAPIDAIRQE
ncbi:MAG: ABC transporter permease [Gemmatimonadaceae bacterium]|jgi:putative ABC transport system permease protein|nr:ABC transporter permease [Gemmatimonadaceae bacterium]